MSLPIEAVLLPLLLSTSPSRVQGVQPERVREQRDPRTQPLTVEDALFTIPDVTGRMLLVGDLDGDGRDDLIAECGGPRRKKDVAPSRLEALSSRDGHRIRVLWERHWQTGQRFDWDAGADVDADGVPDLLIGLAESGSFGERSGTVLAVSGATADVIHVTHGDRSQANYGYSVALLGDLDGDGHAEYAVGAPQCDPSRIPAYPAGIVGKRSSSARGERRVYFKLAGGTYVERVEYWRALLEERASDPGFVRVVSGRTGAELWRHDGPLPGHGFGARLRCAGDLDRDGRADLLVGADRRSGQPLLVLSGATAQVIGELPNNRGPFGAAGDLDCDGIGDLYLDVMDDEAQDHCGSVMLTSGTSDPDRFALRFPEWWSPYSITIPLGDVDGDEVPDFLLGDGNYHVRGPGNPGLAEDYQPPDIRSMSLAEALKLESSPWCAGSWESGAAWLYTGRTRVVILGVWGEPGSSQGMGLTGCPIPDLTGDGLPEIAVLDGRGSHVFAGPGRDPGERESPGAEKLR